MCLSLPSAAAEGDPPLSGVACVNPVAYGADPSGARDSTAAIGTAIRYAAGNPSSPAVGVVCLPTGHFKTGSTIAIESDYVTIRGAGYFSTVIFPSGDYGDIFYIAKEIPTPYIRGVNFENLRIYTVANPTHGAGIHFNQADSCNISHVEIDGAFGAYDVESSIHLFFDAAGAVGNNSNEGSYGYRFRRASSTAVNPSEDFVTNANVRGLDGQTIAHALIVNASDGIQFSNFHFGWSSGSAVLLQPEYENDNIYGVFFSNGVFDNSRYDVYVTARPGHRGEIRLVSFAGTVFETASLDAFYADAPELSDVTAIGDQFTLAGRSGLNISAGSRFKFSQSLFVGNNRSGVRTSHVVLSGTVKDVNLDGASYSTAFSPHPVMNNIIVEGAADVISAQSQTFSGAAERDVSISGAGKKITLTIVSTDKSRPLEPVPISPRHPSP
jgi:hypothetical protein